jgi:carbon monoxide dehydrogenase subunit G
MKLEHRFVVPAPVEEAWAAFNDLERVAPCFPGATLTSFDGDGFEGSCKVKLGPVSLQYTGNGTFTERDPAAHLAVIEARGKDRRGNGTATARVTAKLTASGDSTTAVAVETDLTVTGRPAQFGRGLMQEVSDKLLDQFVACLTKELSATPPSEQAQPPGTAEPSDASSGTTPSSGTMPLSGTTPSSGTMPSSSTPSSGTSASSGEATLDLGSALAPALARRLAPYVIGAVLALLLRRLLRR